MGSAKTGAIDPNISTGSSACPSLANPEHFDNGLDDLISRFSNPRISPLKPTSSSVSSTENFDHVLNNLILRFNNMSISARPMPCLPPISLFEPSRPTDLPVLKRFSELRRTTAERRPLSLFTGQDGEPLESFAVFPWLPKELRVKIWSLNLPGPRFVQVLENKGLFGCAPIANLYVCKESRQEALKVYTFSFAMGKAQPMIPFNFEMDILFIGPGIIGRAEHFKRNCAPKDLARTKRLAVQRVYGTPTWDLKAFRTVKTRGLLFSGLKEFYEVAWFEDSKPCVECLLRHGEPCSRKSCPCACVGEFNEMYRQMLQEGPLSCRHWLHEVTGITSIWDPYDNKIVRLGDPVFHVWPHIRDFPKMTKLGPRKHVNSHDVTLDTLEFLKRAILTP